MNITKLGHCCLLIEERDLRVLTDPGYYTEEAQKGLKKLDIILITHDHQDHLHVDSLKSILQNNPDVRVITNTSVGKLLEKENIPCQILEHGGSEIVSGLLIEGFGDVHAEMHSSLAPVQNTGYFLSNRFFYPGDAFFDPEKKVEILALPVAGPWVKISESVDYALQIKPKTCFPVHEAMLKAVGSAHRIPTQVLPTAGIEFKIPKEGEKMIF